MSVEKKRNFYREKRVAHRKQASISWWDASHSFSSVSRCHCTKNEVSFKDFFRKLRIWSHLLKKSLIENFIFCAVNLWQSLSESTGVFKKSCAVYKNKVFVENAWAAVDKEMGFEEGKKFSYFLCSMKFKRRTRRIF